jgi:2'-5' RNA ligase
MTLDDQPQLRELIAEYQQAINGMREIDPIPAQWLHLTMRGIGFVDEISPDELAALGDALGGELASLEPPWSIAKTDVTDKRNRAGRKVRHPR